MATIQKRGQDVPLGSADHPTGLSDRLGALKVLFFDNNGGERFPPATRFTIVAGGSVLLWGAIAVAVAAAFRH